MLEWSVAFEHRPVREVLRKPGIGWFPKPDAESDGAKADWGWSRSSFCVCFPGSNRELKCLQDHRRLDHLNSIILTLAGALETAEYESTPSAGRTQITIYFCICQFYVYDTHLGMQREYPPLLNLVRTLSLWPSSHIYR